MKKALTVVLVLLLVLSVVMFAACNGNEQEQSPGGGNGDNVGGGETPGGDDVPGGDVDPDLPGGDTDPDDPFEECKHVFGAWEVTVYPSCESAGKEERVCTLCGEKEERAYGEPLGHEWTEEYYQDKAETCVADGAEAQRCLRCFAKRGERAVASSGEHRYSMESYDLSAGVVTVVCDDCGAEKTYGIRSDGIKYSVDEASGVAYAMGVDADAFTQDTFICIAPEYQGKVVAGAVQKPGKGSFWSPYIVGVIFDINADAEGYEIENAFGQGSIDERGTLKFAVLHNEGGVPVTIGKKAFRETGLRNFDFSNVVSIGDNAFDGVPLEGELVFDEGLTEIGYSAIRYAEITSVEFPDSLTTADRMAVRNCYKLTRVVLGAGYSSACVDGCPGLTEIVNGTSLSDEELIAGKLSIASEKLRVIAPGEESRLIEKDGFVFYYDGEEAFLANYSGSLADMFIPESFTAADGTEVTEYDIAQYAFGNNGTARTGVEMRSVFIPGSVRTIRERAFNLVRTLEVAVMQEGVETIETNAFSNCALATLRLPRSLKEMGTYAFSDNTELKEVYIPSGIVGRRAFQDCTALESVTLGDGVTEISGYAFRNCEAITNFVIPDSVRMIAFDAFADTSIIESEGGVLYVGTWAVGIEKGVTSVTLREGTVGIAEYAFSGDENYGDSDLTAITFNDGLLYINDFVFWKAPLVEVTLPASLVEVGQGIFYDCTTLAAVNVPFAEGALPEGWSEYWNNECDATIVYATEDASGNGAEGQI